MTNRANLAEQYAIDELAEKAGGYFALPDEEDLKYTDLLFNVCEQFGIRYYSATPKEKYFVEEVTRVTWAHEHGIETSPAFVS